MYFYLSVDYIFSHYNWSILSSIYMPVHEQLDVVCGYILCSREVDVPKSEEYLQRRDSDAKWLVPTMECDTAISIKVNYKIGQGGALL